MTNELKRYYSLIKERPDEFIQNDNLQIITDEEIIDDYCKQHNVKIGVIYESKYHLLVVDLVKDNKERVFTYERIINTICDETVMLTLHNGKFVLLNQFRHATRNFQYAFSRGFKEVGIFSLDNAKKEMGEEVHTEKSEISYSLLGKVIADSGLNGNVVDVYVARISDNHGKLYANDTKGIIDCIEISEKEFLEMVKNGKILDGFTLSAYSLFKSMEV